MWSTIVIAKLSGFYFRAQLSFKKKEELSIDDYARG
jgi:hypothetical protein